jgi:hypothetical protein
MAALRPAGMLENENCKIKTGTLKHRRWLSDLVGFAR